MTLHTKQLFQALGTIVIILGENLDTDSYIQALRI